MALLEAKTKLGTYVGIQDDHPQFTVFKGIAYAKAPVGNLRWKKPQPLDPFQGIYTADTFSPISVQPRHELGSFYQKEFFGHQEAMSEDSLYLNIWTPATTQEEKLPVLLWIHGGAYTGGYGHEIEFDGAKFCSRKVILVTINYRLGVMGFLSHPWLQEENERGNFGIYDQIAAIQFIHEHIGAFGGDANNITIMGQSAGSRSVQIICSTDKTKGLFSKAIMQSAAGTNSICQEITQEKQANIMKDVIAGLGYKDLAQLRAAPYKVLIHDIHQYMANHQINPLELLGPNIDGELLVEECDKILSKAAFHDIPYMIGCTKDELFSKETAHAILESTKGFAKLQSQLHDAPVYVYSFEKELPGDQAGAFHSGELWYEFGTLKRCWRPFTPGDYELSDKMNYYFSEFVKKGDPNHFDLPIWHKWTSVEQWIQCLDEIIKSKKI
ncbi:MAG: carboxylesterase/lipase family protein [Beduini sp.]|uniref:carboxylesterase/lipase family protein n=1 Tax=Beduini sp. TaxID=1922300 RepID=UPI0011C7532F